MASYGWNDSSWVPKTLVILVFSTLTLTLSISVLTKETPLFLPSISDTAGEPPTSGMFGILMSFAIILIAIIMLIRYTLLVDSSDSSTLNMTSKSLLVTGYIALFGLLIVTYFPCRFKEFYQDSNGTYHLRYEKWILADSAPHLTAALVFFGGMLIYMIGESSLSWYLKAGWVATFRICVVIAHIAVCSASPFLQMLIEKYCWKKQPELNDSPLWLNIIEWSTTIFIIFFLGSYKKELKNVPFHVDILTSIPEIKNLVPDDVFSKSKQNDFKLFKRVK